MDPSEKISQSELAKTKGTNFFKVREVQNKKSEQRFLIFGEKKGINESCPPFVESRQLS